MSYLKDLKALYALKVNFLKKGFEIHCENLIHKKLNFDHSKLKDHILDNFVEEVTYHKQDGIVEIDTYMGTINLSDLFVGHEDLLHILLDNSKNEEIEDYLENLTPFKNLKQSIESEFDGLKFELRICVDWTKNSFDRYIIEEITCTPAFVIEWD